MLFDFAFVFEGMIFDFKKITVPFTYHRYLGKWSIKVFMFTWVLYSLDGCTRGQIYIIFPLSLVLIFSESKFLCACSQKLMCPLPLPIRTVRNRSCFHLVLPDHFLKNKLTLYELWLNHYYDLSFITLLWCSFDRSFSCTRLWGILRGLILLAIRSFHYVRAILHKSPNYSALCFC